MFGPRVIEFGPATLKRVDRLLDILALAVMNQQKIGDLAAQLKQSETALAAAVKANTN